MLPLLNSLKTEGLQVFPEALGWLLSAAEPKQSDMSYRRSLCVGELFIVNAFELSATGSDRGL